MATIGSRIKELRLSKELTQEEFGRIFGIVKSTVSLYENNNSTPNDQIKKEICKYFNVTLDYLAGVSNQRTEEVASHQQEDVFSLTEDEKELITYYSQLNKMDKQWIMGQIVDLIKEDKKKSKSEDKGSEDLA